MSSVSRLVGVLLSFSVVVSAAGPQEPAGAPNLTAAIIAELTRGQVRLSAPGAVCTIRLRVFDLNGVAVVDSGWKDGNVIDWPLETPGAPLTAGAYRCIATARDLEGRISEREATLIAREGQLSIEPVSGERALTIVDRDAGPKITLLAHDGRDGLVVSAGGDLSFRFGNFFSGADVEKMRLTSDGRLGIGVQNPEAALDVNGLIRARDGILFPDGTVLTIEGGRLVTTTNQPSRNTDTALSREAIRGGHDDPRVDSRSPVVIRHALQIPVRNTGPRRLPGTSAAPAYKFVTAATGVGIWTTTPAYPLDVGGIVNTNASYYIGGSRAFALDSNLNVFAGTAAGSATTGYANSFIGCGAGEANTTGGGNIFVGSDAGNWNTSGNNNTFIGQGAGMVNTSGSGNTVVGSTTSSGAMTDHNVMVGMDSLVAGGSANTVVGYRAKTLSFSGTNKSAFGAYAQSDRDNTVVIGSISGVNDATATATVGIGTQLPNQNLGVGGGVTLDADNLNNGTYGLNVLSFGTGSGNSLSGETMTSKRTSGANQYGLDFYTAYANRMCITHGGNVGIGTTAPTAGFEVAAGKTTLADSWSTRSSLQFKENIRPIDSALEKAARLRGVSFDYKGSGAHSLGFVAEEVAEVLPEAVQRDGSGAVVGLDYDRITPLLVEALKAQQRVIRALEQRIENLETHGAPPRE